MEMRKMMEGGLQSFGDVSFNTYIEFIGAYEELNDVRKHKIDEESMAHQYKRLIMQLGPALARGGVEQGAPQAGQRRSRIPRCRLRPST